MSLKTSIPGPSQAKSGRYYAAFVLAPILLVAINFAVFGRSVAEKTATDLVMPGPLIFFALLIGSVAAMQNKMRTASALCFIGAAIIWLSCSSVVSQLFIKSLEQQVESEYASLSSSNPLDYLVVLGGGTGFRKDHEPQLNEGGDRLGLALTLYKRGLAKKLLVTGDSLRGLVNEKWEDPSFQAKSLLIGWGVAPEDIGEINGTNTSEEIANLKENTQFWSGKRCGLCTSAFHMPRAMRLAKRAELDLIPITANYRGSYKARSLMINDFIPNFNNSGNTFMAIREYIGIMLGR